VAEEGEVGLGVLLLSGSLVVVVELERALYLRRSHSLRCVMTLEEVVVVLVVVLVVVRVAGKVIGTMIR